MISEEEFGLLDAESGERVALRGVDGSARIAVVFPAPAGPTSTSTTRPDTATAASAPA